MRACWRDDPSSFRGEFYEFDDIRLLPKPAHDIPIWVGGSADATYRRAVDRGDGFHAIGLDTDGVRAAVARVRRDRPDEAFTISLRTGWDPQGMDPDRIRQERAEWEAAGLQHVIAVPWRNNRDDFIRSMELLAEIVLPQVD
jgi:luciferase-like monooxygenase